MSGDQSLSGNADLSTGRVFSAQSLITLLLRPRAFFADRSVLRDRTGILIAAALVGVSNAMDRIDQNMVKADLRQSGGGGTDSFTTWIVSTWATYWGMMLVFGMFSAVLTWYLRGWWYRKRLEWSGAVDVAPAEARSIATLPNLVYVLPILAWSVLQTFIYRNYAEAWQATDAAGMLILVFLFWSCRTSYCAATTVFTLHTNKARFWFLILPAVFYLLAMGVFTTLYLMLN